MVAQLGETVRATYQILLDILVLAAFVPSMYIFVSEWCFSSPIASCCGLVITSFSVELSLVPSAGVIRSHS